MVETADALFYGHGVAPNPHRGVEWAQRAAESGSDAAKLNLGFYYFSGYRVYNSAGETRLEQRPIRRYPSVAVVGARGRRQQSGRAI